MNSHRPIAQFPWVSHEHPLRSPHGQRGVALIVALVLILVMSLLGTFAIRNATQSERSINGIRTAEISREAAETALRFCEQIAMFDGDGKDYTEYGQTGLRNKIITGTIASEVESGAAWRDPNSWKGANVIQVPAQYYKTLKGAQADPDVPQLLTAPRCLIQKMQSTGTPVLTGYLITARGFANNAKFDTSTGKSSQGAEAWLQSVLTRSN